MTAQPDRASSREEEADHPGHVSPADALKDAGRYAGEFKAYVGHYLSARSDAIKLGVRRAATFAVLGVIGLIAAGAVLVTAAVLLLTGLATAIGAAFEPDKPWVGQLFVGALVLGGAGGGIWVILRKITARSRQNTVAKYERKQSDQRAQFGRDVTQRAAEQAAQ